MKKLFLILFFLCSVCDGQDLDQTRVYNDFSAGVVDTGTAEMVPATGLWDAENIVLDERGTVKERLGTEQFADTITGAKRILALHSYYKPTTGVYYPLMVFDTDIYLGTTVWTAQSQSLTTNLEGGFVDAYDKTYYNNGTDTTKIFNGASWSADASFKKGTIMAFYENRIIVAVANLMWYTDLGLTTFQSTSYMNLNDTITGLLAGDYYLYVFTKTEMYRIAKFEHYDGVVYGPSAFEKMACHVGTASHRSLVKINDYIYTLTNEGVFRIEQGGITATRISEECETSFDSIDQDYLSGSSGAAFDDRYFLAMRETGQTYNNKVFVFDTQLLHRSPSQAVVPAFYPYTYAGATLYPEVLAVIPTSTGEKRLMFGASATGRTFQMETGTDDNDSAIISYAIKPLLNDARPDLIKRLMKVQFSHETLGTYDLLVAFKNDEFGGYADSRIDLTGVGELWGTGVFGTFIWGEQDGKKTFEEPQLRGYYFLLRMKNASADEPWKISRIGCMFRVRGRYQPLGNP